MIIREQSACGVGFVASLAKESSHENLEIGLKALVNLEHRGGTGPDLLAGDGAGIMTDIPYELFGIKPGDAVANIFLPRDPNNRIRALNIFTDTFRHSGFDITGFRDVPINLTILPQSLRENHPDFMMAFIRKPNQCTYRYTFEKMLYTAKQLTRSKLREAGIVKKFFFTSLSAGTVVYKALLPSRKLAEFYPDLTDRRYKTKFALFHRRFSTNTAPAWDTAQPFRLVGHNGEINTISGNRAWAYARERALGLCQDELLTHIGISDSGSVNEMIEALMYRSSIPELEDILAIMMPKAQSSHTFYKFWGRAMEAWDGPALFTYSDGRSVGARLDRHSFRPCRWLRTKDRLFLSSEAGSFEVPEDTIVEKGSLSAGGSIRVDLKQGTWHFFDASNARENRDATFDPHLTCLDRSELAPNHFCQADAYKVFNYSEEDLCKILAPMVLEGKEGIGSMGDTAGLPLFSSETRSLFDYFYQSFAQVTNPPLDYLRESLVNDMTVVLGQRPNIFEPKELIPPKVGIALDGPVLDLGQMEALKKLDGQSHIDGTWPVTRCVDMTFPRERSVEGFRARLNEIKSEAIEALRQGVSILIFSDRRASYDNPPMPAVLLLSSIVQALNQEGMRLRTSCVIESGQVKNPHDLAVLVAFGAAAVCPYVPIELAYAGHPALGLDASSAPEPNERARRVVHVMGAGLLKIMSKMGISVVRSYHSSELFTLLGIGPELMAEFFPKHQSLIGGLNLDRLIEQILRNTSDTPLTRESSPNGLLHNHLYKEHPRREVGERHSMTLSRAKIVHRLTSLDNEDSEAIEIYQKFVLAGRAVAPITLRHLLRPKESSSVLDLASIQSVEEILQTFGSGAVSFGAISAEAQRDIILAMREIGGRSNSGEGGENPYYFSEGITASIKQVASGRFGVTAEYLTTGKEIQIKICQGAKPGEGGQLMAVKVNRDIARARNSDENVDLISPPPMHDIYSIEDLKQLIYEVHQLSPNTKVSVKLVSGTNIGIIAVGVAKAGADIIHISGHDGGTGAAPLGSMKHAGLPWEIGLIDVHRALVSQGIRHRVTLRVDGGLTTGEDIVVAAMLGAEQFDFGKLVLIAEGCIMARICEKNTCPTGIATHDPKFKRLYRGNKDKIIRFLRHTAKDVQNRLSRMGKRSLSEITGLCELLEIDPEREVFISERGIDLSLLLGPSTPVFCVDRNPFIEPVSSLNEQIVRDVASVEVDETTPSLITLKYSIRPQDRAVLATLAGMLSKERTTREGSALDRGLHRIRFIFEGSAGQGFGVFLSDGMTVRLIGEANDSVAKSMSGGRMVVLPSPLACFDPSTNSILGNCALYGATGGTLFVLGLAGSRFAVRNSGATVVVEGVGIHACEYMTRGRVVILGPSGPNLGAGMTGGVIYLRHGVIDKLNINYVKATKLDQNDILDLRALIEDYSFETQSPTALKLLEHETTIENEFVKIIPIRSIGREIHRSKLPANHTSYYNHTSPTSSDDLNRVAYESFQ